MDCEDYMDYGNDDHYHDKDEIDYGNDDEFYHLIFVGCRAIVMYVIKHVDKKPCRNPK
jgi:hypothetical protein